MILIKVRIYEQICIHYYFNYQFHCSSKTLSQYIQKYSLYQLWTKEQLLKAIVKRSFISCNMNHILALLIIDISSALKSQSRKRIEQKKIILLFKLMKKCIFLFISFRVVSLPFLSTITFVPQLFIRFSSSFFLFHHWPLFRDHVFSDL